MLGGPVGRHGPLPHHAAPLPALAHHGHGLALVVLAPALRRAVVRRGCLLVHHGHWGTRQTPVTQAVPRWRILHPQTSLHPHPRLKLPQGLPLRGPRHPSCQTAFGQLIKCETQPPLWSQRKLLPCPPQTVASKGAPPACSFLPPCSGPSRQRCPAQGM